ncbi:EpsG family protein [Collinsella ihumii]|uniref:EpsG family protein n=1 Tax=Collinsella ihumii TaxID=1720204 RepID=UPI00083578D2|nr:EpsG family protein [Collinsella ihumii]
MILYLSTFALAAICASIATALQRCEQRAWGFVLLGCAVLIPSLVAGLRSTSVGTDTSGYVVELYDAAGSASSLPAFFADQLARFEPLFLLLVYCSVNMFGSIEAPLFFMELLNCVTVVAALYVTGKGRGMSLGYLLYLLLHFNESLNMMRQSLAMGFLLLALAFLYQRRFALYAACLLCGIGFHLSAVIGLMYPPILYLIEMLTFDRKHIVHMRPARALMLTGMVALPVVFSVSFASVMSFAESLGIVPERFTIYLTGGGTALPQSLIVAYLVILGIQWIERDRVIEGRFTALAFLYGIVMYLLVSYSEHLWRFGTYFMYPLILGVVGLAPAERSRAGYLLRVVDREFMAIAAIVFIVLGLWYLQIVVWGNHDTLPYVSDILGVWQ